MDYAVHRLYEVASCPFCGVKARLEVNPENGQHVAYFNHDRDCYFSCSGMRYDKVLEPIFELWNRRA